MVLLESLKLEMGELAHNFELKGIDGKTYGLLDFADSKILVLVFMCNHCPYVQAIWPRLVKLAKEFEDRGVQFVGINPNTASAKYDEETFEKMKEYAAEYKMNFPYLEDTDQSVARTYEAQCTPDIYVYQGEKAKKLAYHGRLDDNWKDENAVEKHDLAEALEKILSGKMVPVEEQKPAMGCSIKWVS